MVVLVMTLLAAQAGSTCAEGRRMLAGAELREAPDVSVVALRLGASPAQACDDVQAAISYLEGLIAAERAWRAGGSADALAPVRARMAELDVFAARGSSSAALARLVLAAEAAAAQNEAGEMALLFEQAFELEFRQRLAGQPALPVVSSFEAAGDSWLRLYRYREAEQAYSMAAGSGTNPRIESGLRRARRGSRAPR